MGFAAGSGSLRDKLAGAVAAPGGVFPETQQGKHILTQARNRWPWGQMTLFFYFPAQAYGIF